jgi:hypothetical protein
MMLNSRCSGHLLVTTEEGYTAFSLLGTFGILNGENNKRALRTLSVGFYSSLAMSLHLIGLRKASGFNLCFLKIFIYSKNMPH